MNAEIVEHLGFEWVRLNQQAANAMMANEFRGVSIHTDVGVLVLARVERLTYGMNSVIRRVLVKASELNTLDDDMEHSETK